MSGLYNPPPVNGGEGGGNGNGASRPHRADEPLRGIECPACGCRHFWTTHTEQLTDGTIRRRKQCRHCGRKKVTIEKPLGQ